MRQPATHSEAKRPMLKRQRRVIFNSDGGDARQPLANFENPLDFLNVRTTPLAGSQVDTISYCTSSGFGLFKHNTKIGSVMPLPEDGKPEVLHALIERGTDPLREVVRFGHANGMEVFWSMRMNDTHDGSARNHSIVAANRFKHENPDCLMGRLDQVDTFRKWSAVDYDHEKVREMALACIEEVCRNYDVDGIELDFFRHPVLFKATALGRPVTEAQRAKVSDLMRRIAALVKREGEQRGRPLVVAARTPDDPDYAATIGLDIETWMREGLIDLFIPSGYFRQCSWRDSVERCHRYGVHVYPGLSDSRIGGGHHKDRLRASDECYRARAATAWQAGADGIYVFNNFNPHRRFWHEIGDPESLNRLDKVYFASNRGTRKVPGGAYPYEPFIQIPTLTPEATQPLPPEAHRVVRIDVAEDFSGSAERPPVVTLSVKTGIPEGPGLAQPDVDSKLGVGFNGHALSPEATAEGWRRYALDPAWLRPGCNTIEVINRGNVADLHLLDAMVGVDRTGALLTDTSYLDQTRKNM